MRRGRLLRLLSTGVAATFIILGLAPASASSANISHSYHANNQVVNGDIVSLDPQHSDYLQLANTANGKRLLGVAVVSKDSLLAVDATNDSTQVATSGTASTLVSSLNGDIKVGDQIAVSPFNGIGMKSVPGAYIIGLAQTDFNGNSQGVATQEVTDKDGKKTQLQVGYVRLNIALGIDTSSPTGSSLNTFQKLAKSLTGRTISTSRVIISMVVAILALVALITLIYASIYGSIISVGRNPLAKYAVFRTLGAVLGMAALTTVIACTTIFLLLR